METGWKIMEMVWGKKIGGNTVDRREHSREISRRLIGHVAEIQMAGDLGKLAGGAVRGTESMLAQSAASPELLAWSTSWSARQATFRANTAAANAATGTSNQLGRTGVQLAQPLYGAPGSATEVTVEVGRRMDIAPALPWLNTSAEWEVKLVQPQNLANSSRVASEITRDIARAQRYGANAEIGWVSWRGFPQGMEQRLEAGGIIAVDAPKLAAEMAAPKQGFFESLANMMFK